MIHVAEKGVCILYSCCYFISREEQSCKITKSLRVLVHYNATLYTEENTGNIPPSYGWFESFNIKNWCELHFFFIYFFQYWVSCQLVTGYLELSLILNLRLHGKLQQISKLHFKELVVVHGNKYQYVGGRFREFRNQKLSFDTYK